MAGEYWLIYHITGYSLAAHPFEIGRFMLITINVIPLWIFYLLLARLLERWGRTDWGRIYVMAAATLATFLTTFAVSLNNHITAAVTTMVAIYAAIQIWYGGRRELRFFVLVGLFAALTASDELPALSLFALLAAALMWKSPRQTLLGFVPAALVVAAGFFATNYIAHASLRPPYMHRSATNSADNWYDFSYTRKSDGRVIESYWKYPAGIDKGEASVGRYAFNVLIGHHGIFSLTPIWLLAIPGVLLLGAALWVARFGAADRDGDNRVRHVLYRLCQTVGSELWRDEQWIPLGVLVCAALADRGAARRRLACPEAMGSRTGLCSAGRVGDFGQLSNLEPMDASLADQLLPLHGLGKILNRCRLIP